VPVIRSGKLPAGGPYAKIDKALLQANIEKCHEEVNDKGIWEPA
jgi:hypothetical protein